MGEEEGYQDQQPSGGQNLLSQIVASEETIQELSKALLPSLLASLDSANRGGADSLSEKGQKTQVRLSLAGLRVGHTHRVPRS